MTAEQSLVVTKASAAPEHSFKCANEFQDLVEEETPNASDRQAHKDRVRYDIYNRGGFAKPEQHAVDEDSEEEDDDDEDENETVDEEEKEEDSKPAATNGNSNINLASSRYEAHSPSH